MRGKLQVVFADANALVDPYLTIIEIANIGRLPISSEMFDRGRGMSFELGVEVVEVLSVERTPESAPLPSIVGIGSQIELRPELIAVGEVIRASILSRDKIEGIALALDPLRDNFKVSTRDREALMRQRARRQKFMSIPLVALLIVEVIWLLTSLGQSLHSNNSAFNSVYSLARGNACEGVQESAASLTGAVVEQIRTVETVVSERGHSNPSAFDPKFAPTFASGLLILNLQISDLASTTSDAATLGINLKESKPTIQTAKRFAAILARLPASKTLGQQKTEITQAQNLSLQVLTGVRHVIPECKPHF